MNATRFEEDVKKSRCLFEHLTLPALLKPLHGLVPGNYSSAIHNRTKIKPNSKRVFLLCICHNGS